MKSSQPYALSVRDKSAFFPLNSIPEVNSYLEQCFPYIKNSAINSKDEIWMLPISINVPCIIYSPVNCDKYDIKLTESMSWTELFEFSKKLNEDEKLRRQYQLNEFQVNDNILNRYNTYYALNGNKTYYDTELFRSNCKMIINNKNADFLHTHLNSRSGYSSLSDYYDDYIFEMVETKYQYEDELCYNTLKAVPTPSLYGNEKSCGECMFFCINANSENIESAIDFIRTYCSYMLTTKNNYMLKDSHAYSYYDSPLGSDLYKIYSDSEIAFQMSDEAFLNDYIRYYNEEFSLDEFIKEVERKTNMFINE